ncbi:hypothetical protein [Taibaiella koreensis]|uniref:hypothetical protein n=1 Tax=Taibaiella koreensis TaxID=1268548 RepID=UPI000E599ECF|nr:hypothetical protein [Taibaiella koreensis]
MSHPFGLSIIKPSTFLVLVATILFVCSLFIPGVMDIHFRNKNWLVATPLLFSIIAALLLLFAAFYHFCSAILYSGILTWLHIIITVLCIVPFLVPLPYTGIAGAPRRAYGGNSTWSAFRSFSRINVLIAIATLSLCGAQLIFLFHILSGILRRIRRRR